MRNKINILVLMFMTHFAYGQITDVSYSMEYNSQTCLFDCYLNINSGQTESMRDRVQFNAQFTIVTPEKSQLAIVERHMPLQDNRNYKGTVPTYWDISSLSESPVKKGKSYYSITPRMIPTSFYNDLNQGDKVKLFSVSISPMVACLENVKVFGNGDLISENRQGLQSDFSNAFTIGGTQQKYSGRNGNSVYPVKPVINDIEHSVSDKVSVIADVNHPGLSICQSDLDYNWYSPNGKLISNSKDFPHMGISSIENGFYKLVVEDNLGCKAEKSFTLLTNDSDIGSTELVSAIEDDLLGGFVSTIFPNPSINKVNLEITTATGSRIQVNIYDTNGRILKENILDVVHDMNTKEYQIETQLKTGIYTMGINVNGNQSKLHKLIIIE